MAVSAIFALVTYDTRLWKIIRRPPLLLPVSPKPEVVFYRRMGSQWVRVRNRGRLGTCNGRVQCHNDRHISTSGFVVGPRLRSRQVWRSFLSDSVVSTFASCAHVYRNDIGRYSDRAFFVGAHFEISTMSPSGRTGCVRSMKLSGIIALGHATLHTRHGAPPPFRFAARGRKRNFFQSRFSPQRLEISTPFFHCNVPHWGRYTAPLTTMGWDPPFGGQVPPTQIYVWGA